MPAVSVIKHPALAPALVLVQARRAKALRASVSRRPCTIKKETPGRCRWVSSSHCVQEYDKPSSATPQSRQGRPIVARYVSEGALAHFKQRGRSGLEPRLSEAKSWASKTKILPCVTGRRVAEREELCRLAARKPCGLPFRVAPATPTISHFVKANLITSAGAPWLTSASTRFLALIVDSFLEECDTARRRYKPKTSAWFPGIW
jgi:hypothetical protein